MVTQMPATTSNGNDAKRGSQHTRIVAAIIIALLVALPLWSFTVLPRLAKVPEDLENELWLHGSLGVINMTTFAFETRPIAIKNKIEVYRDSPSKDRLYLRVQNRLHDPDTGEMLDDDYQPDEVFFAIDRRSGKYLPEYSETEVGGYYGLPIGNAEQRDYAFWDFVTGQRLPIRFVEETEYHGIDIWVFEAKRDAMAVSPRSLGYDDLELNGQPIELVYDRHDRYYIEPISSVPVDRDIEYTISARVPDLRYLPMGFRKNLSFSGELEVANETALEEMSGISARGLQQLLDHQYLDHYNLSILGAAVNTDTRAEEKIALIDFATELIDADTGEPLPDEYQQEPAVYGIDRFTNEHVEGYGDRDREGHFIFPLGRLEKRSYGFWDNYLQSSIAVEYEGEEQRDGMRLFRYRSRVNSAPIDAATLQLPMDLPPGYQLLYSGTNTYWADPSSAVIIATATNMTVELHSQLTDRRWPVMALHYSATASYINESKELAEMYDLAAPYSGDTMPAFHLEYRYTAKSRDATIESASLARSALLLVKYGVPAIIASVAGTIALVHIYRRRRRSIS